MIDLSKYNLDELIEIKQKVEDEISSYYARRRRKYEEQLKYFMMGVDEGNGWLEYEIEES